MSNPLAALQAAAWESDSDPTVHRVGLVRPVFEEGQFATDVPNSR